MVAHESAMGVAWFSHGSWMDPPWNEHGASSVCKVLARTISHGSLVGLPSVYRADPWGLSWGFHGFEVVPYRQRLIPR